MEIKLKDVGYIYNEGTPFSNKALEDINLNLNEEKIIGIIGKSGSGKTTLVQLLNGLFVPSKGSIQVGDFTIKKGMKLGNINDLRRKVGLVFQFPEEQFFNPTVKDEISFALKYFKYKNERINKQVSDALTMVGLDNEYLSRNVFNLSGGEKRKIAIASILVFNPKIVILDEPTVGLDYKSKKRMMDLIKKLKERYNKTVIIVSHDIDMLNVIADDIVVMNEGTVMMSGNKNEVFKNTSLFHEIGLRLPKIVEFTGKTAKKGIILGKHTDIMDLMKDIYRNV